MTNKTHILSIKSKNDPSGSDWKIGLIDWFHFQEWHTFLESELSGDFWPNEEVITAANKELETNGSAIKFYDYDKKQLLEKASLINKTFPGSYICQFEEIDSNAWQTDWKSFFKKIETQKFLIVPPWLEDETTDKIKIIIEPAMAFGTGQHESTLMCILELEKLLSSNKYNSVLDVGTGTGILSIATASLGANIIYATDIDQKAVDATEKNKELNSDLVKNATFNVQLGSVVNGICVDLIFGNILKDPNIEMMPEYSDALNPGGALILAGFLTEDVNEIEAVAIKNNLSLLNVATKNDWACMVLKK